MRVRRMLSTSMCAVLLLTGCAGALPAENPTRGTEAGQADAVLRIVRDAMAQNHLKAAIVRVTVDGHDVVTQALGESMTGGSPSTTSSRRGSPTCHTRIG